MQHPHFYLTDTNIKNAVVEKNGFNQPTVRSGGFALTFKINYNDRDWALRCFHKISADRDFRQPLISAFIKSARSNIFVGVDYQSQGIYYQGSHYPISIMEWVKGETLGTYISNNISSKSAINNLSTQFLFLIKELNRLKMAHGDLSHSNIMIKNNSMVLIDYDGMFIPAFSGMHSTEIGHRNFQHPGRDQYYFSSEIDRFSAIVLYLALRAISYSDQIYQDYGLGGEGLLFTKPDFLDPDSSKLFSEVEKIPELSQYILNFKRICKTDISNIPTLQEFIINKPIEISLSKDKQPEYQLTLGDWPINARNKGELLENEDESVVVIGKIDAVRSGTTRYGQPYVFINVGRYPFQTFTVVIWAEILEMLEKSGRDPKALSGRWISVSGVIGVYNEKPQIVLDSPANITTISEKEAKLKLDRQPIIYPENTVPENYTKVERHVLMSEHERIEMLNHLYGRGGKLRK